MKPWGQNVRVVAIANLYPIRTVMMDRLVRTDARRLLTVFATLFFCCSATGCGLLANVMYAGWGGRVHARCKALEGKRVALVAHPASVTEDLVHSLDALIARYFAKSH